MRLAALLCLLLLASACSPGGARHPTLAQPPAVPPFVPAPSPPQAPRVISVGEEIKDTLTHHGEERLFELTAPSDGTLVVCVSWEPARGFLQLWYAGEPLGRTGDCDAGGLPSSPDWSTIVGKLAVVAGRPYRVIVADGARWDYDDLLLPFELTTSLQ